MGNSILKSVAQKLRDWEKCPIVLKIMELISLFLSPVKISPVYFEFVVVVGVTAFMWKSGSNF